MGSKSRSPTTGSRTETHGRLSGPTSSTPCASSEPSASTMRTDANALSGKVVRLLWRRLTTRLCPDTTPTTRTTCVCGARVPATNSTSSSSTRATISVPSVNVRAQSTSRVCFTPTTQAKVGKNCASSSSISSALPRSAISSDGTRRPTTTTGPNLLLRIKSSSTTPTPVSPLWNCCAFCSMKRS